MFTKGEILYHCRILSLDDRPKDLKISSSWESQTILIYIVTYELKKIQIFRVMCNIS